MKSAVIVAFALASTAAAQQGDTIRTTVLMASGPAGIQKEWQAADGSRHFYFEYNDRGRGPALHQVVRLGPDGYPRLVEITGHDYLKAPVSERFTLEQAGGAWKAAWKNTAESSSVARPTPAYYVAMQDASANIFESLLLRAPNRRLPLLPQGEARLERVRTLPVQTPKGPQTLTLYATYGLGFTPNLWWADERGHF